MPDLVQVIIGNLIQRQLRILLLKIVIMNGLGYEMADGVIHIDGDYFFAHIVITLLLIMNSKKR